MAWTTPRTWSSETATAALLNTHIRDNLNAIAAAGIAGWASFTPTWTSSGVAPAIGNGTLAGTYAQIGKLCLFEARMTCGTTTTYGSGVYAWATPVTAEGAERYGGGLIVDTSLAATHGVQLGLSTTTAFQLRSGATTNAAATPTSPMTWASTDTYRAWGMFEV